MRYMFLIYSREEERSSSEEDSAKIYYAHAALMQEAISKGILIGAEPLCPTSTATTVRMADGKPMITDGPFAETKEQLAGYYILECKNLDEAIEWAARIPTMCNGGRGSIEIRPLRALTSPFAAERDAPTAAVNA